MSSPGSFATQLRSNRAPIKLVDASAPGAFTLRVESAELLDAVRVTARNETIVADVKQRVLAEWYPTDQQADEFVLKFRGWEILDENVPLSAVGAADGSILLLAYRRRRPVR